jgi:hypothetical protein
MSAQAYAISPAIKLLSIFAVAIALQSGLGLVLAVALSLWALLLHRSRFLKLLRRVRLLILVLFAVTLFMTPGAALFPSWGLYPTEEGIVLAVAQLLRLVGMLAAVSLLLDTTDDRSLAAGSLALLQPLAGKRQWPERAVARLLLVFHYLETSPKPRNLQDVLALAGADLSGAPEQGAPEILLLDGVPLSGRESALGVFMLGAAVLSLVWGSTT